MKRTALLILLLVVSLLPAAFAQANTSIPGDTIKFTCADSEATIQSRGAATMTVGDLNIYIGTNQVRNDNQNPIVKAFDQRTGAVAYCCEDYETTNVDGKGRGLHWNGTFLYGIFAVDGGSTTLFSQAASNNTRGWTRSVGPASGAKNFAIIARLNPGSGDVTGAAFITARLESGNSNSVSITGVECTTNGNLRVSAESFFSPRKINGNAMTQSGGDSPFDYTVEFTPDLRDVTYTAAVGWETDGSATNTTSCPNGDNNFVLDGGFDHGTSAFALVGDVAAPVNNGVVNMTRTNVNGLAALSSDTSHARFQAGDKIEATLRLGNTTSVAKNAVLRLTNYTNNFVETGAIVCFFGIPANTNLRTYTMRGVIPDAWSNTRVELFAEDFNDPALLVDELSLQRNNGLNVAQTECVSPSLPSNKNLIVNGDFSSDTSQGFAFLSGEPNGMPHSVSNGVASTTRSGFMQWAAMVQPTRFGAPAGTPFELDIDLGNTFSKPKYVALRLWQFPNNNEALACFFTVPPNSSLQTYTLRGVTPSAWTNAEVQLFVEDFNEPSLLIDNVDLRYRPNANINALDCDSPLPNNKNMVVNGDFDYTDIFYFKAPGLGTAMSNGIMHMTRSQLFDGNGAPLFTLIAQNLRYQPPAGSKLEATVQLGNTSGKPKMVSLHLMEWPNNATRQWCVFIVPPNTPLQNYTMQTVTTADWSNIDVQLFVEDFGEQWLQVDNLNVQHKPNANITALNCDSPLPANTTLLLNGDMDYGNIFFSYLDPIVHSASNGVLNLTTNTSASDVGLLAQPLFRGAPANTPFEVTMDVANPTNEAKLISLRLWDFPNQSNEIACTLEVPANYPMSTVTMRGVTNTAWTFMDFQLFVADSLPSLQVDNIVIQHKPNAGINGLDCNIPPASVMPIPPNATAEALEMLNFVNQARCEAGLNPVVLNTELNNAALRHSNDMAYNMQTYISHTGTDGSSAGQRIRDAGYNFRGWAENVAAGNSSAFATFEQWRNSSGHWNNIMNPSYREMGLVRTSNSSARYRHYWTQVFGTRSGAPQFTCAELGYVGGAGVVAASAGVTPADEDSVLVPPVNSDSSQAEVPAESEVAPAEVTVEEIQMETIVIEPAAVETEEAAPVTTTETEVPAVEPAVEPAAPASAEEASEAPSLDASATEEPTPVVAEPAEVEPAAEAPVVEEAPAPEETPEAAPTTE